MSYPTVSVCMIVKDEEKNIGRALNSVRELADEIIVVDTGSKDGTVEIAKSFGAKVYFFEWCDDFSAARNESLRHATKDYILWLDADDEFESQKSKYLKRALSKNRDCAYYLIVKISVNSSGEEALQLRVFPNRKDLRFQGRVHEQIYPSIAKLRLKLKPLNISIQHHGYSDRDLLIAKLERNKRILELEIAESPKNLVAKTFYARTLMGLGKVDESERVLVDLIESMDEDSLFRNSNFSQMVYFDLFEILSRQARVDEMERYASEYQRKFGTDFFFRFLSGTLALYKEDYKSAEKHFTLAEKIGFTLSALPFSPSTVNGKLYAKKAFSLAKQGKAEESRKYVKLALETKTNDLEVGNLIADTCLVLRDHTLLKSALDLFNFEPGRLSYLEGIYHMLLGNFADAVDSFRRSISAGYKLKNCYLSLAIALRRTGLLDDAIATLKEFLVEQGEDEDLLRELLIFHLEKGEAEVANSLWRKIPRKTNLEDTAVEAYLTCLLGDYRSMLKSLMDLHKLLFGDEPFSAEAVLKIPSVLSEIGQKEVSDLVWKCIRRFSEAST